MPASWATWLALGEYALSMRPTVIIASSEECRDVTTATTGFQIPPQWMPDSKRAGFQFVVFGQMLNIANMLKYLANAQKVANSQHQPN